MYIIPHISWYQWWILKSIYKFVSFSSAETYPAHTKCVSEEEKYSAKGFVSRPSANKGEIKQKKWQDIIQSLQENQKNLTHDEQTILNAIVNRENVPRKKPKFQVLYHVPCTRILKWNHTDISLLFDSVLDLLLFFYVNIVCYFVSL